MRYLQDFDGEWIQPVRKGYRIKCCGCGLVHIINFKLVKKGKRRSIQFQAFCRRKHAHSRK